MPVLLEGEPTLQQLRCLSPPFLLIQQLQPSPNLGSDLLQPFQYLAQILEILVLSLLKLFLEEPIHILQDNHIQSILPILSLHPDIAIILLMIQQGKPIQQVIQGIMLLPDMLTMRGRPGLILLDEPLMGEIGVAGGVGLVEDDGALALALEVEADLAEIVLVIGLEILVGVVVFVVVVVEALGVQERGFVVADAGEHGLLKILNNLQMKWG